MNADFFEDCPFRAGVLVIHQEGSQDQRVFLPSMPRQIHPAKLSEYGNTLEMIGKIVQTVLGTVLTETEMIPEIFPAPSANDAETSLRNRNEGQFSRFRAHVCYKNYLLRARNLDSNATAEQLSLTCFDMPSPTAQYPTGESLYEAFWRKMLCDVPEGLERPPAEYGTYFNSYHEFKEAFCTNGHSVSDDIRRDQLLIQQTETFDLARSRYPPGRRFCITSGGHMSWVSQKVKMGDVLVILKGGDIVYALRRHREDSNTYRLLGGCYLHDFMYVWRGHGRH
jgi:hypothetical protein